MPVAPSRKRNRSRIVIGVMLATVLLAGVASFLFSSSKPSRPAARKQEIISITLPPPPPPPRVEPPPPKEQPPEKEEMVEQEPVPNDEPPPEEATPESPPSDLGTGIAGNGPDMGLGSGNGGKIGGNGHKGGGSKYGWYAAKVQSSIASALRGNSLTKSAVMSVQVKVWPDSSGRITRVQLVGSSGSAAVDEAIKNRVLTGMMLPEPPPAGMPLPIVLRINARKPL